MEQTRNSRVYYYMTLKCDLDLEVESGYRESWTLHTVTERTFG